MLVVVAMALLGEYTKTRGRLLLTALSLAAYCSLALAPSALAHRNKYVLVGTGGLAAAVLGLLLVVVGTWATPGSDAYWKATAIVAIGAVSVAYISGLLLLVPQAPSARILQLTAIVASALVPVLAWVGIIAEIKAAPFWWAVSLIIVTQITSGLAALALHRWPLTPKHLLRQPASEDDL